MTVKDNKYAKCLALVLLIHILIAVRILNAGSGQSPEKNKSEGDLLTEDNFSHFLSKEEKEQKPFSVNFISEEKGDKKKNNTPTQKEKKENICEGETYIGIGVGLFANIVTDVPEGYPAHHAGIKEGDEIIGAYDHSNPDIFIKGANFKNKEGGVDIVIERKGKRMTITTVREKICYKKNDK